MDWETLKTDCLACQRCPLHTTRHNVVFGQGVENAEVLFVGEGPGQSEDEQGLPFVGRSGQLLDFFSRAVHSSAVCLPLRSSTMVLTISSKPA